jgi:hypothetical protein
VKAGGGEKPRDLGGTELAEVESQLHLTLFERFSDVVDSHQASKISG